MKIVLELRKKNVLSVLFAEECSLKWQTPTNVKYNNILYVSTSWQPLIHFFALFIFIVIFYAIRVEALFECKYVI